MVPRVFTIKVATINLRPATDFVRHAGELAAITSIDPPNAGEPHYLVCLATGDGIMAASDHMWEVYRAIAVVRAVVFADGTIIHQSTGGDL